MTTARERRWFSGPKLILKLSPSFEVSVKLLSFIPAEYSIFYESFMTNVNVLLFQAYSTICKDSNRRIGCRMIGDQYPARIRSN